MTRWETIFSTDMSVYYVQHGMNRIIWIRRSKLLNGWTDNAGAQIVSTSYRHYQQSAEKYCFRKFVLPDGIGNYATDNSDKEPEIGYYKDSIIHKWTVAIVDRDDNVVVGISKKRLRHSVCIIQNVNCNASPLLSCETYGDRNMLALYRL